MDATSLAQLFEKNALELPSHTALVIDGHSYTYQEIVEQVQAVVEKLQALKVRRLGIFASRSLETYLGILSAHWIGAAYVPINPTFPAFQIDTIITRADVDAILVDAKGQQILQASSLPIIQPTQLERNTVVLKAQNVDPSAPAYIMFTSGSTGEPKAIPISFANLTHLIHYVQNHYDVNAQDKVVQHCKITFDVSIMELILAWAPGATLYIIPESILSAPAKFIQDNAITVWCSVPSVIAIMNQLHLLKPNGFPSLKLSVFCGEALMENNAYLWQQTSPGQIIENLYGPTEATVFCLTQEYQPQNQVDVVPIGQPLPGMFAAIINDAHEFLSPGEHGELVLSGPQVTSGYLNNPSLNQEKFLPLSDKKTWYLTGDSCYQDGNGVFHYVGRIDNQCKITGFRVELEGIEFYLRKIQGDSEVAVCVLDKNSPLPVIAAAIVNPKFELGEIKSELKQYLPPYMIPTHFFALDELPKNANGKLDRKQLSLQLNQKLDQKL